MNKPSDRWALAARTQAVRYKRNRSLRLITDETIDDPLDMSAYAYIVSRGARHELYRRFSKLYKDAKRKHMKENLYKPCDRCDSRMHGWLKKYDGMTQGPRGKAVTIDHIIPLWLVFTLELPMLEIDRRNFSLCCSDCNGIRSLECQTVGDIRRELGDKVLDKLFEKSGIYLPDHYHHTHGYLTKEEFWASQK